MSFFSWLRNRTPNSTASVRSQRRQPAPGFRPRLETLEGRCLPSTLTVTNLNDSGPGSLRYEIAQVTSKDNTIVFDKKLGGAITLTTGELVISKSLTIQGNSKVKIESQPWVDGGFNTHYGSRILEVDGAATTVALSGLTITGGGGTRLGGGVTGSPHDGYGGAVLNFGTLTLSGCTLGGGTVVGHTLVGNEAQFGGAIANFGTMTLSGCDVSSNHAYGFFLGSDVGGGIYNAGSLTVSGGDLSINSAAEGGGIYNAGTTTVSGCTLSGDSASSGGAIYNAGGASALTVLDSIFSSDSPDNIYGPYTDGGGNTFN